MLEIRAVTETWENIVLVDGLKAAKGLVDVRTDLEYVYSVSCEESRNKLILFCGCV